MAKLIAFDFDGVLHENPHYAVKFSKIDVTPIILAHERGYAVAVMTCNDIGRVATALRKQGLSVQTDPRMDKVFWDGGRTGRLVLVTNRKVAADIYVDDKAMHWEYGGDPMRIFTTLEYRTGFKTCPDGRHWGAFGGAGVVPFGIHGGRAWVLMGQRSKRVSHGLTWGGFGGALEEGEEPWDGAQRECTEEANICPEDWLTSAEWKCPTCGWTYTTFLAEVPVTVEPSISGDSAWETEQLCWMPYEAVSDYKLHPGMKNVWPRLEAAIEEILKDQEAA